MECKILFLEPFYGGSHKDFADGLVRHSKHDITLMTLPSRFWKWRMRGAALYFAEKIHNPGDYDLIFASDLLSLSDLKSILGKKAPPVVLYFHENQLSYPAPTGGERDMHFGFTDITSAAAADRVMFNSHFHCNAFFNELPGFLQKMPEYRPSWVINEIREKSQVVYPGIELPSASHRNSLTSENRNVEAPAFLRGLDAPLILWNHRWEFDKGPELFFRVLYDLDTRGFRFYLALAGENFQMVPKPFLEAKKFFRNRIVQYGYIPEKVNYQKLLLHADIVVSTAYQENFGISVLEGIAAGCLPLLPYRLSYPEILPPRYHPECLYETTDDLTSKLSKLLHQGRVEPPEGLVKHAASFSWNNRIAEFDSLFEKWSYAG